MFGATEDSLSEISPNQLTTAMELLDEMRFPIVYFFTMNENACHRGLPNYMTDSINQAIETQSECCEVQKISLTFLHPFVTIAHVLLLTMIDRVFISAVVIFVGVSYI